MPDAYEVAEGRFINFFSVVSAADALYRDFGPVPSGRVWTILSACGVPSVNETRTWWFAVEAYNSGYAVPVTWPTSLAAVVANQQYPAMVREGMELKLFPGERLYVFRDAATAGSSLTLRGRFIESDMPLYHYEEPQLRNRMRRAIASAIHGRGLAPGGGPPGPLVIAPPGRPPGTPPMV